MKISRYYCLGLVCLTSACINKKQDINKQRHLLKSNIIYILADDLGYGDLGCYGQKYFRTPELDKMASEGMRFTDHYAGSTVCAPSRCALLTGKHTGHAFTRANFSEPIPDNEIMVAKLLKKVGYKTAMIGKGDFWDKDTTGLPPDYGFDLFIGYGNGIHAHNSYPAWLWRNHDTIWLDNKVELMKEGYAKNMGGIAIEKKTHSHDVFMKEAFKYIEQNRDSSFFLYLSLTIPHANPEARHWNKIGIETPDMMGYDTIKSWPEVQQAYAAYISFMDRDIGRFLNRLKELGLDSNTLVIFSSDNGPHNEGWTDPQFFKSAGPFRGVKNDLYEGGIRVPFIAWWPGKIKAGIISNHISAFWDFLPTACEIAGIKTPDGIDGISYLPELLGKKQKKHDYLYWEFISRQAVRQDKWKAVRYDMSADNDKPVELYNLNEDVGETKNVAGENPQIAQKLLGIMKTAHKISPQKYVRFEFEKQ